MKTRMLAMVVLASCSTMTAQIGQYLGPGILSRGAGDIGMRAGQDVDLRFFVNATGFYESGIQPFSLDAKGQLVTVGGQWGTEADLGAYGVHNFKHARLGLDYKGIYRHYTEQSFYDGTDHSLALGYTYQKSRRLVFDMQQTAGSVSQGTSFADNLSATPSSVVTPASLLFDNRANYLQSSLDVNLIQSERNIFTFGGDGFGIWRKAQSLAGVEGYMLHGSIRHRLSRQTTVGASFEHSHYDYPKAFGESDVNSYSGTWDTQIGRSIAISLQGGVFQAEVQGLQRVAVDPAIVALLGVSTTIETFYRKSLFPQWNVGFTRRFPRANLSFRYQNGVSTGNGVYLTSRQQSATAAFSYTATRKWSFSVNASYARLDGIGQNLQPYSQLNGGSSVTYALTRPIHLIAQYDARHQEIVDGSYVRTSYRSTFGISFSPGDVPLAFH